MKTALFEYLNSYKIMALATYGETPWICWVCYVLDKDFNLYFTSSPKTQHIQDIQKNKQVACAITDSVQNPLGEKKGVQILGTVEDVTVKEKLQTFFEMWKNTINNNEEKVTYHNYINNLIDTKVYKVVPKRIQWFNQSLADKKFVLDLD